MKKNQPFAQAQRSTLSEVAELAGVSPSTVSRILNGTAKVNEAKVKKVNQAIKTLNFLPDPAARSLAGGKTMSVGVLTQFIDSPFYGEALRGIEDVLLKNHYAPLFVSGHWNAEEEFKRLQMLAQRKVDGIIVLTGRLSDQTLEQIADSIPLVVTGRQIYKENLFGIDFDHKEGMCLAVKHLHALGHERIAFISGPLDHADAAQRLDGYKSELLSKSVSYDPKLVINGDFSEAGGYKAAQHLIESRAQFSALIAANDQMAFGARLALQRAGFRVPEDISLVGFDDLPHAAFTLPPLTTVKQPIYMAGVHAATAVLHMIDGELPPSVQIPAELVVRESTRRFRL
jgi:LacI family transcriptional regulator